MNLLIRPYRSSDYDQLTNLYRQSKLYGGQFDEDRDSFDRLNAVIEHSPNAILIAEKDDEIVGSVSLFKDPRLAWLFRFVVIKSADENKIAKALYNHASEVLKSEGHKQVLVYAPSGNTNLDERYKSLGFNRGNEYLCYWNPKL